MCGDGDRGRREEPVDVIAVLSVDHVVLVKMLQGEQQLSSVEA